MEIQMLVKKRAPVRTTFTKLSKNLINLIEDDLSNHEEIESQFASLKRIYSNLRELDDKILEAYLIIDEEVNKYEEEYSKVENYNQIFDNMQTKMKKLKENNALKEAKILTPENVQLKLPEIELVKFGGDIRVADILEPIQKNT